jgi:hypothetical protein
MVFLYIDPGTGSLFINLLAGLLVAVVYYFRNIYYRLSSFFAGDFKLDVSDFSHGIVFFSEGKNYWRVFQPVIEELIQRRQKVVYLSADKDDLGLSFNSDFYESHYIGDLKAAIFQLNRLKTKMCVMTTPQLGVISLRRSDAVKHYCHIIHSPTDIHAYKKFAFDYYDSVLCSSNAQIYNLRYLEERRNSKAKNIFQTGCTYYDLYDPNLKSDGSSVLVAPTWGDRTFFKLHGKELLRHLIDSGHRVILRPHPQSWISDKDLLNDIILEFQSVPNLVIDKEIDGEQAFRKSMILICDVTSGTLFDAAFLYKIPVIGIQFDWPDGGYEASDLTNETAAQSLLDDIGAILNVQNIRGISNIINTLSQKSITPELINKHIFNFMSSGKIAADQIVSIYKKLT